MRDEQTSPSGVSQWQRWTALLAPSAHGRELLHHQLVDLSLPSASTSTTVGARRAPPHVSSGRSSSSSRSRRAWSTAAETSPPGAWSTAAETSPSGAWSTEAASPRYPTYVSSLRTRRRQPPAACSAPVARRRPPLPECARQRPTLRQRARMAAASRCMLGDGCNLSGVVLRQISVAGFMVVWRQRDRNVWSRGNCGRIR